MIFWWFKIIAIGLVSLFFLVYGIETLVGAYSLKSPMDFVMFFFSASFMILVSGVGLIFSFFRIYNRFRLPGDSNTEKTDD